MLVGFAASRSLPLPPGVRQLVKTLFTVCWRTLDQQYDCTSEWAPAGEAEAGRCEKIGYCGLHDPIDRQLT
jgi:hypothetical protein